MPLSARSLFLIFTAAVVGLVALVLQQITVMRLDSSHAPSPLPLHYRRCTPRVERVEMQASSLAPPSLDPSASAPRRLNSLARSLRTDRQPRLFRRSPLASHGWRAFDHWSADYFIRAAEAGVGPADFLVKRAASATVKFANLRAARPFVRMEGEGGTEASDASSDGVHWPLQPEFAVPFRSQNMSVRSFFDEIAARSSVSASPSASDPPPSDFLYFADGLSVLGPTLARDLLPIEPLCPFSDVAGRCDMSVWIGAQGVSAYPHYDSSHNLFLQVKGRKRFTLAAPAAARCGMGLYPSLHPFYRQAHRDLMEERGQAATPIEVFVPTPSAAPTAPSTPSSDADCGCHLKLFDVVLDEGDLLYIPPHWFHRVMSVSALSFSVNSWWISRSFGIASQVLEQPLPFQAEWNDRLMLFATRLFVQMIYQGLEEHLRAVAARSSSTPALPSGSFLAAELLVTRFYPLFESSTQPPINADWCAAMQRNITAHPFPATEGLTGCTNLSVAELQSMLPAATSTIAAPTILSNDPSELLSSLRAHFAPYVARPLALYRRVDAELARLHVHNYVEEIVWFALRGRVEQLYPVLACCIHEPQ